jgi:HEAT repeat protein
VTDIDGLDLTPQQRSVFRRADQNPEHLTSYDAETLVNLLTEGSEDIRNEVTTIIEDVSPTSDAWSSFTGEVESLTSALDAEEELVRMFAARTLGYVGWKAPEEVGTATGPLAATLEDGNVEVRQQSALALARIASKESRGMDGAVGPLVAVLDDEHWTVRESAARALGQIGSDAPRKVSEATGPLVAALADEEPGVRSSAADALGRIGRTAPEEVREATEALTGAIEDHDEQVRGDAVAALRRIGRAAPEEVCGATDELAAALGDQRRVTRDNAAQTLGEIGNALPEQVSDAIDPLVDALDDEHEWVRESAAEALGKIGSSAPEQVRDATGPLVAALDDENWEVRKEAAKALGHVGPAGADNAVAEATDRLCSLLSHDTDAVRLHSAIALGRLHGADRSDSKALERKLEERFNDRQGPAALLIECLDDDRFKVAVAAAFALFRAGTADHELRVTARDRLREGLRSSEHRRFTAQGVKNLAETGPQIHPMMREVFYDDEADGDPAVRDLVPDLVELLDSPDSDVRRYACRALGHLDATAAAADLEQVAEGDDRAEVRDVAAAALDRIETTAATGDETDDSEPSPEPGDGAPADSAESDATTAGTAADTTPTPTDEGEAEPVPTDEPGEPTGSLADRAALYSRLLEYARTESLRECCRWAEELHTFVEANPVDDEGYAAAREETAALVEERLPNEGDAFGTDHDLVTGDRPLAKIAPELHEAIGDVAFAVRRCYVRGE